MCFFCVVASSPPGVYSRGLCPPGVFPQFWLNQNRCAALTTWLEGSREDRCLKGRSPRGGWQRNPKNEGFGFVGCFLGWLLGKKNMAPSYLRVFFSVDFLWVGSISKLMFRTHRPGCESRTLEFGDSLQESFSLVVSTCSNLPFMAIPQNYPAFPGKQTGYLYVFIKHIKIHNFNQKYIFRQF